MSKRDADFEALLEEHEHAVINFCMRMVRNQAQAEDIAQIVFLAAFKDFDGFEGRSSVRTWLLGIASHRCLDALKADRRRNARIENNDDAVAVAQDPSGGPSDGVNAADRSAALDDCLDRLPDDTKLTVLRRFYEELSYEEMSRELEAKADTLHARVARAYKALKKCLEGKGWKGWRGE